MSHKRKKNKGEVPQYYIEGDHEPIISKEKMQEISIQVDKLLNSNENGLKDQEKFNEEYKKLEITHKG